MCKEFVDGKSEDFEKHLVECYKGRPQCSICGQTFRLRSYLYKHERCVHKLNTGKPPETNVVPGSSSSGKEERKIEKTDKVVSEKTDKVVSEKTDKVVSGDEDSDWQNESDYSIGDPESEKEEKGEKVVSSKHAEDESLLEGRLFRKSTNPAKPSCPKRKTTEEKPTALEDERKVKVMKIKEDEKGLTDLKEIKVECALVKKEASSETVTKVTENGDEIYADKVTRKKQKVSQINVDIGNIVPEGSVRTSDILLQINGEGSVQLRLKYRPESDD